MKAKVKVLYRDGNYKWEKPFTYEVIIRKWEGGGVTDYILESFYTTQKIIDTSILNESIYKTITCKKALEYEGNGKIIGIGVDTYRALKKRVEKLESEWDNKQ